MGASASAVNVQSPTPAAQKAGATWPQGPYERGGKRGKHHPSDDGGKGYGRSAGKESSGGGGGMGAQGKVSYMQRNKLNKEIVAAATNPAEFEALLAQLSSERRALNGDNIGTIIQCSAQLQVAVQHLEDEVARVTSYKS